MTDFPLPVERCELPHPTAIVVNDEDAGLFVLVDRRVADADLSRLAEHLELGIGLYPQRLPPPVGMPLLPVARDAARLRATIAAQVTEQTRAHVAMTRRSSLAVVAAPAVGSDSAVTPPDPRNSTTPNAAGTDGEPTRTTDDPEDDDTALDLLGDRPHTARAYDYALGGKTNYYADRVLFENTVAVYPTIRYTALSNRAFMHRAVRHLAEDGIDQFLDVGTGIPTEPNLHQVVQAINPATRVVYVDNDPIVLAHAAALMVSSPQGRTSYVEADARDPAAILAAAELRSTLDLTRPVAISFLAMLHFLDDAEAERLVHSLLDGVPAGSALVLSHATFDNDDRGVLSGAVATYRAAGIPVWPRTRDRIEHMFLQDLQVVEPGIVSTHRWRPDDRTFADLVDADLTTYAVLARKPTSPPRSDEPEATSIGRPPGTTIPTASHHNGKDEPGQETGGPQTATAERHLGPPTAAPVDLATDRAHSARMYDYWLSGKTHFQADRDAADSVAEAFPSIQLTARSQRGFVHRSARYVAASGIDQFLDIGTGIPTQPNLHEVVQGINPAARVAYVDNDPIVLAHAAALMTSDPRGAVTYIHADARDPAAILAAPELLATVDLSRPVGISTIGLLHFLDDETAQNLIQTLLAAVPAGSTLALTQGTLDAGGDITAEAGRQRYHAAGISMWYRTRRELEMFLEGLDIIEPGITFTHRWRPESTRFTMVSDGEIAVYAALARKK